MKAREFNAKGIRRARRFLDEVRADPAGGRTPPRDLLEGPEYTRPFRGNLTVEHRRRPFASRREVGEYLAPRLKPLGPRIADRTSLWSWLGLFHFENTVRIVDGAMRLSPLDETFVLDRRDIQNLRGQHRHYLRSAWQLYEVHGDNAAFLLNQPPTARGAIANTVFQSQRIFNSVGIVPLMLGLYTNGSRPKRGFQRRPGGVQHLLRVLDQLERTYDVYGMPAHALVRILPPEFKLWTNGASAPAPKPKATAGPSQPAPNDPELERWEADLRRTGQGSMRYKGFRATVSVNAATDALQGRIMSPAGWWIGRVEAAGAAEFKQAFRAEVDEHLARGSR